MQLTPDRSSWLNYRTVWRWHFYAGLFCIPFVIWLSVTGSVYLFKPQIERWLDRPYDSLRIVGPRATAEAQVQAALAAVPGSSLHFFELPRSAISASRVIVGREATEFRVYVHPQTLQVLHIVAEDRRPMRIVFRLHGELLLGDTGSRIVELAASWAIVMILTGLYLWWPRQTEMLAGVLYLRLRSGQRIFWRDLHAVTGVWVSAFALFLLITGLPWASGWGSYLKAARALTGTKLVRQDWSTGRSSEIADRLAMNANSMAAMSMDHASTMDQSSTNQSTTDHAPMDHTEMDHTDMNPSVTGHSAPGHSAPGHSGPHLPSGPGAYTPLDRMIAVVTPLALADPVLISPPQVQGGPWIVRSDAANRPLRSTLTLDARTGAILRREDFGQRGAVDRLVGIGVAAHEGQLFGLLNQLLGLFTAIGLVLLSVSAVVLWWRRRAIGVLGAPLLNRSPNFSWSLAALILGFAVYLPMLGLSLAAVLIVERFLLRRLPSAQRWLGLKPV